MSEDLDLKALAREYKEIDMTATELALDTGKIRQSASGSMLFMTGLSLVLAGLIGWFACFATMPAGPRLAMVASLGALLVVFLVFFRQQWRGVAAADALLAGTPAQLVRGRKELLEVELNAWTGPGARFFELGVGPGVVLMSFVSAASGGHPWAVPVLAGVGLVAFSAYGRLNRVPALREGVEKLEALAATLD